MSQQTTTEFEDWLSAQLVVLASEADVSGPDGSGYLTRARPARIRQRAVFLAAAAAFAILAGFALSVGSDLDTSETTSGATSVNLVNSFTVDVTGIQRREAGTTIYQAVFGPEPQFDTSEFGPEFTLESIDPAEFVVPTERFLFWNRSQLGPRFILLGAIDGFQIGLNANDSRLCVFLGNNTSVYGGGECDQQDGRSSVILSNRVPSVDPPVGLWTGYVGLPSRTSVVVAHFEDGSVQWQRPVGRTVIFRRNDSEVERYTLYSSTGSIIVP